MKQCLIAVSILFAIGATVAEGQEPAVGDARPAMVATVAASDTALRREYPGIVFPSQEVELSFRVGGRIVDLLVRGGTQVEEGDVIARLDPRDFETNIAQIESQIDQADAQLAALRSGARVEEIAALEAAVESAQAQVDQVREQTERTRELTERGVSSPALLEQEEANLRVAIANLQVQREQLAIGQAGGRPEEVEAAEAAIRALEIQLETANDNLQDATLRAPFAGIVARRDVENFINVSPGQSIVLLQNLSTVQVAFDIPGLDVVELTARGPDEVSTQVFFDAAPDQSFDAELTEFSTQADAATQTYRGRISVRLSEDMIILPGMVAQVIVSAENNGTRQFNVPLTAIGADPDGSPFVWVVDPSTNAVSQHVVILGEASGNMVSVTDGVSDGDVVVTAGVSALQEGMTIRPIDRVGG